MQYYIDFDRTVFDTDSFKREFARRPKLGELVHQALEVLREAFSPNRSLTLRRIVTRALGTYASHRRFGFAEHQLKEYLYPDAIDFFDRYGKDCTIVTYGVRAFITAKVASALTDIPLVDIVYTSRKKGRTMRRLTHGTKGPFTFVDDAVFQLESVGKACPDISLFEMRRDGGAGDGRWPVVRSLLDLPGASTEAPVRALRDLDLSEKTVAVIMNTASGSYNASAEPAMRTLLSAAGIADPMVWCEGPEGIEAAFREVEERKPDILVVLGGDGTIRAAAESCTSEGPLLIALPGGTMNMLPKALYGNRSWQDALRDTLAAPYLQRVSGGVIGEREFFIAAILGAPTLWADAREALRAGDIGQMVEKGVHAFQHMLARKVRYRFSGDQEGEADAIAVICPLISEDMQETEHSLEAAAIDVENAAGVLELASAAAFGKWRESARVTTVKTRTIRVTADKDIPLILDGETMELGQDIEIRFLPEAFTALVPQKK